MKNMTNAELNQMIAAMSEREYLEYNIRRAEGRLADITISSGLRGALEIYVQVRKEALARFKSPVFVVGQFVQVIPHTTYSNLSKGTVTSWMREHQHNGYKRVKIVSIATDGSVEVEVNAFGDIDVVDLKHLVALS